MDGPSGNPPTPPYSVPPSAASAAPPPNAPNPSGGADGGNTTAATGALFVPPRGALHTGAAATQMVAAQGAGDAPRGGKAPSTKRSYIGAASVAPPKKAKAPASRPPPPAPTNQTSPPPPLTNQPAPPSGNGAGAHTVHDEMPESCSVELWEIIVHGYREPQDPVRLTSTEFYNRQLNASARDKIRSGIHRKLLDQVNDIDSAKELWDRIVVLQEGTDLIQSALYETAKQEAHQFMIREGESVADAYARLGALRVRVKGLGVEKYNDGFEMNEAFIKSKVIAMIAVKQEDTNLALNLQIMTKSADLNSDDIVSYVAANENMAKAGKRLMAMNRVDEASHNHEASHNLALKARADHGREEDYEIEEDEEMTSTSDIATDFAFFAKKYKGKLPMLLNDKKKKRTCYNCDEESHFANECPYEKRVDKPKFIKGVKPRLKPNPINDRYKKNKGRAFVGAEYLSDEEEEDEENVGIRCIENKKFPIARTQSKPRCNLEDGSNEGMIETHP
ncbi:hypothetical protein QYE76_031640 [Lolium multiflorum]|uniref:CCHC-type domain-containing protein n=1 Tax=Lolium multiflorum TaxID=4521 RepID=A0AAD8VHL4_LOLMU|nr:hypothetical protein QYE76_031640 [Lolium multiflorum]